MADAQTVELLLVDDDAELREDMTRFFSRRGYSVCECGTAEQALSFADRRAFNVIVLDLMMPGMTGLEMLQQLRKRGTEADVVMLTSQGTIETAVEAMKLGACEFVTKPVRLDDLDILVQKCVHAGQATCGSSKTRSSGRRSSPRTTQSKWQTYLLRSSEESADRRRPRQSLIAIWIRSTSSIFKKPTRGTMATRHVPHGPWGSDAEPFTGC